MGICVCGCRDGDNHDCERCQLIKRIADLERRLELMTEERNDYFSESVDLKFKLAAMSSVEINGQCFMS